ncbi:MAG: hypothetical protein V3V08_12800 [Nannocystaceae bacterium]
MTFDENPETPRHNCPDSAAPDDGGCFADSYVFDLDTLPRNRDRNRNRNRDRNRHRHRHRKVADQAAGTARWWGTNKPPGIHTPTQVRGWERVSGGAQGVVGLRGKT